MTTELVHGNYEPDRRYPYQEPKADYAKWQYANEVFHQHSCSEASP
jgi:hypothetical protein